MIAVEAAKASHQATKAKRLGAQHIGYMAQASRQA
jgi:hypothetical protein